MLDGKVQGVGLRESIKKRADELGLVGQARNLADGRVGVVCEGRQDSIEELVGKLRGSPGLATVNNASVSYSESEGEYDSFIVVRGDSNMEVINAINAGVDQLKILHDDLRDVREEVHGVKEEVHGVKEEVHGVKEEVHGVKEEVHGVKEEVHGVKEEVHGVKEEVHGVSDKLDDMNETNKEGFRRTQEEIRGVSDRLDVMNETTQEGFRRVRA